MLQDIHSLWTYLGLNVSDGFFWDCDGSQVSRALSFLRAPSTLTKRHIQATSQKGFYDTQLRVLHLPHECVRECECEWEWESE